MQLLQQELKLDNFRFMVDFFDFVYSSVKDKYSCLRNIHFYSLLRFSIRIVANVVLPIYFKSTSWDKKYRLKQLITTNNPRIIVSMTSFPVRISRVWLVVETVLRQSCKPDMIILWLSKEQYPTLELLPKTLLSLQNRGLRIELREKDLRSHKKYCYALKEFPNDHLITIDDDIFYNSKMIKNLLLIHNMNRQSVICQYGFEMKYNKRLLMNYRIWEHLYEYRESYDELFFGSGGGTFFPAHSLSSDAIDSSIFMNICPFADDVWLNAMARLNNTKIIKTAKSNTFLPIVTINNVELCSINNGEEMNDKQIKGVSEYYIKNRGIDPFSKL